jgi:hypothetical protein
MERLVTRTLRTTTYKAVKVSIVDSKVSQQDVEVVITGNTAVKEKAILKAFETKHGAGHYLVAGQPLIAEKTYGMTEELFMSQAKEIVKAPAAVTETK